jgi:hypothetical protein
MEDMCACQNFTVWWCKTACLSWWMRMIMESLFPLPESISTQHHITIEWAHCSVRLHDGCNTLVARPPLLPTNIKEESHAFTIFHTKIQSDQPPPPPNFHHQYDSILTERWFFNPLLVSQYAPGSFHHHQLPHHQDEIR